VFILDKERVKWGRERVYGGKRERERERERVCVCERALVSPSARRAEVEDIVDSLKAIFSFLRY
jgi:hypothetical protein